MPPLRQPALLALLLCSLGQAAPCGADIYIREQADGAIALSNAPTEDGYRLLVSAPPAPAREDAGPAPAGMPYAALVEDAAREHTLDAALLHAVIAAESAHNPAARSHKGALGLMQLMPDTARRYGVADRRDPSQNIRAGARYLKDLLRIYRDDLGLSLAAYNAGEGAVAKYGNRIPPYPETERYVSTVLKLYQRYRTPTTHY